MTTVINHKKELVLKVVKIILYLLSVFFIGYFVYKFKDSFELLKKLTLPTVAGLVLLTFVIVHLQSQQFLKIVRTIKKEASWKHILAITYISSMYNNILPAGGAVAIRTALLKKINGIAWSEVTALSGIYYMISYLSMALLLFVAAFIAFSKGFIGIEYFSASALICLGVIGAVLTLFLWRIKWPENFRLSGFINRLIDTIALYKYKFRDHFEIGTQQLIIILLTGIRLYLSFLFIGIEINFWKLLFIQSFMSFSLVFSLTPGNLGVKEGMMILFAGFLGIDKDVAMVGSLVDRGVGLLAVLLMGILGKTWLFVKFR